MQQINTAMLLKHHDLNPVITPLDKTIHVRDNRKAYFQRKQQANRQSVTVN